MPIYVYQCEDCGRGEEYLQKMSDPPMTECEHCGGKLAKQLTAAAFHLKGGGWYSDGYASTKQGGSDSSSGSDGGSSSSSSSSDD
jgi:putative FmdB family regulatory protein